MKALVVFESMFGNTQQIPELFVEGTAGPLVRGERERVRRWGEELAVGLAAARPSQRRVL